LFYITYLHIVATVNTFSPQKWQMWQQGTFWLDNAVLRLHFFHSIVFWQKQKHIYKFHFLDTTDTSRHQRQRKAAKHVCLNIIMPRRSKKVQTHTHTHTHTHAHTHYPYWWSENSETHKQTISLHSLTQRFSHDPFWTKARAKWWERVRERDKHREIECEEKGDRVRVGEGVRGSIIEREY